MKLFFNILLLHLLAFQSLAQVPDCPIIPRPLHVSDVSGLYDPQRIKKIVISKSYPELKIMAKDLQAILQIPKSKIKAVQDVYNTPKHELLISVRPRSFNKDYYKLSILPVGVKIEASSPQYVFYAIQSLDQLYLQAKVQEGKKYLMQQIIEDESRFSYRGMHLDVSRHFFSVDVVKKYIDLMARYKMNYFHWHLTDDQGWRIQIKQYPDLTDVGALRLRTVKGHSSDMTPEYDETEYKYFYTQDEIKEVVAYAASKYIEVIPEIEMPGHSMAALAAYPFLGCTTGPYTVQETWGVFDDVFCSKDTTLQFIKNVLTEVCALFPGKYIHIGGDECPKTKWKTCNNCQANMRMHKLKDEAALQAYFIREIENHLGSKNKILLGWDEILEGGLPPRAAIMSWRGMEGGIVAASQQHPVIMTPTSHCYFDYYQSSAADEPLAIGGLLTFEKVYSFNPIPPMLDPKIQNYILGAQGNVWTEYIDTEEKLWYMSLPRMLAMAEVVWSSEKNKNYTQFVKRMPLELNWLKQQGINPSESHYNLSYTSEMDTSGTLFFIRKPIEESEVWMKWNKPFPGQKKLTALECNLQVSDKIEIMQLFREKPVGKNLILDYKHHKAAGKEIKLLSEPANQYFRGGKQSIINGIAAPESRFGGQEWTGFEAKDAVLIIDLKQIDSIQKTVIQTFQSPASWIYFPKQIEISYSVDGSNFTLIKSESIQAGNIKVMSHIIAWDKAVAARYIKVQVSNHGNIAEGMPGSGHIAWLFLGEIEIW